ncbi:MAG: hypothetical protein QM490_02820 [Candidatus Gracilibacteria bacterium]
MTSIKFIEKKHDLFNFFAINPCLVGQIAKKRFMLKKNKISECLLKCSHKIDNPVSHFMEGITGEKSEVVYITTKNRRTFKCSLEGQSIIDILSKLSVNYNPDEIKSIIIVSTCKWFEKDNFVVPISQNLYLTTYDIDDKAVELIKKLIKK